MDLPLVSCLCPTHNRREFIPRMLRCFASQDYLNLELIVLDDGTDPIKDLMPDDPRVKYFYEPPKHCHAQKMNKCFELAQGEFGIVFDDDDVYVPNRVTRQITPLIENPSLLVSGSSSLYYYRHGTKEAYRYSNSGFWLGAIAIRKSAWTERHFDGKNIPGADNRWLQGTPKNAWCDLKDPSLVVASIHATNDCRKNISSSYIREPWETIERLMGEK